MTDHLNAALLAGSTSMLAQAFAAAPPWWQSLLYSLGAALAGALLNWILRQAAPPAPPAAQLSQSGGGA